MPTKKYFISWHGIKHVKDSFNRVKGAKYEPSYKQVTTILHQTFSIKGIAELKNKAQQIDQQNGKHSKILTIVDLDKSEELYNSQKKHTFSFLEGYVNPKKPVAKL